MALFESYERREKQILAVLKEYGMNSIEEAAEVTKAAGLDVIKWLKVFSQSVFENAKWAYTVRRCYRNQKRLQESSRCSSSYR